MAADKNQRPATFGPGVAYAGAGAGHTGCVAVTWVVKDNNLPYVAIALVAALLNESPKAFNDTRAYLKKTMLLNDASIDFSAGAVGGLQLMTMEVSFIKGRYGPHLRGVERQVLRLAEKIIVAGPKTDEVSLTLAKGKLLRANADAKGSLKFKARLGLLDNFLPAYATFFRAPLDDDRLKSLTAAHIEKATATIFSSPSFVAVAGSRQALTYAQHKWATLDAPLPLTILSNESPKKGEDLEIEDLQSQASMVNSAYALPGRDIKSLAARAAGLVLTEMVQNSDSPLFNQLREQGGFTYAPRASFLGNGNVLIVSFTTDRLKKERALKATNQLVITLADQLTPAQFTTAQNSCLKQYQASEDFPEALVRFYAHNLLLGTPYDVEQLRQALTKTTLAEVKALLTGLTKIGSYAIVGTFTGGE